MSDERAPSRVRESRGGHTFSEELQVAELIREHCIDWQGVPHNVTADAATWLARRILARLRRTPEESEREAIAETREAFSALRTSVASCILSDANPRGAIDRCEQEILALLRSQARQPTDDVVEALKACEEVLRLVHGAAGEVSKDAPMPSHSTFEAWKMADEALRTLTTDTEGGDDE